MWAFISATFLQPLSREPDPCQGYKFPNFFQVLIKFFIRDYRKTSILFNYQNCSGYKTGHWQNNPHLPDDQTVQQGRRQSG